MAIIKSHGPKGLEAVAATGAAMSDEQQAQMLHAAKMEAFEQDVRLTEEHNGRERERHALEKRGLAAKEEWMRWDLRDPKLGRWSEGEIDLHSRLQGKDQREYYADRNAKYEMAEAQQAVEERVNSMPGLVEGGVVPEEVATKMVERLTSGDLDKKGFDKEIATHADHFAEVESSQAVWEHNQSVIPLILQAADVVDGRAAQRAAGLYRVAMLADGGAGVDHQEAMARVLIAAYGEDAFRRTLDIGPEGRFMGSTQNLTYKDEKTKKQVLTRPPEDPKDPKRGSEGVMGESPQTDPEAIGGVPAPESAKESAKPPGPPETKEAKVSGLAQMAMDGSSDADISAQAKAWGLTPKTKPEIRALALAIREAQKALKNAPEKMWLGGENLYPTGAFGVQ